MLVSLSVLSTLALLVQSIAAARLPFDPPSSPRSSVPGATELKDVLRRRQARSADVVRRLRQGPNRKRQDPSAVAMCAVDVGVNVVGNPDFESQDLAPWSAQRDSQTRNLRATRSTYYGYAGTAGFVVQNIDTNLAHSVSLQQDVTVCANVPYSVAFDLGRVADEGDSGTCTLDLSIKNANGDELVQIYQGEPCSSNECQDPSPAISGLFFTRFSYQQNVVFSSADAQRPVTVVALYTCAPFVDPSDDGDQAPKRYVIDNVNLGRI